MARLLLVATLMMFLAGCYEAACTCSDAGTALPEPDVSVDGPTCIDTDGDGIDDAIEGDADVDGDGTPNRLDLDSDGDRVADALERGPTPPCRGYLPYCACGVPVAYAADPDGDGLDDGTERAMGLDGCAADSDRDGCPDGATCDTFDWVELPGYLGRGSVRLTHLVPHDVPAQSVVRLDIDVPAERFAIVATLAVELIGGGRAAGDHFVDVAPGSTLVFDVVLEQRTPMFAHETLVLESTSAGDDGVLSRRPLHVMLSCDPPTAG